MMKYKEMNTSTCKMILKFCSTFTYGFWVIFSKVLFYNKWSKKYGFVLILSFSGYEFFNKTEKDATFFRERC